MGPGFRGQTIRLISGTDDRTTILINARQLLAAAQGLSMPAIKPGLQAGIEGRIQDQLDNPGMSQANVDRMYVRGADALAQREASTQQQLAQGADSMGFGRSGDLLAGQRSVAGDFSGQRNTLRRDLDLGAETDRLDRGMQAANAGTAYLDSQRTQNRMDQSLNNQMSQDEWMRGNTESQQGLAQQRYEQERRDYENYLRQQRVAGGATQSNDPRNPGFGNTGPTTSFQMPRDNPPMPPGTNITSPWAEDRMPSGGGGSPPALKPSVGTQYLPRPGSADFVGPMQPNPDRGISVNGVAWNPPGITNNPISNAFGWGTGGVSLPAGNTSGPRIEDIIGYNTDFADVRKPKVAPPAIAGSNPISKAFGWGS